MTKTQQKQQSKTTPPTNITMDAFQQTLRQTIHGHLGHQQDMAYMKQQLAAMGQAMNLCLIQSPQGKMYATGMRMDFSITDPLHWSDVEEHIRMEPFVENNQTQFCPIEQVQDLRIHIGGRNKSFSEASRVMCGQWNRNTGRIGYYFGFENFVPEDGFQPPVEVIVTVVFTPQRTD